MDGTKPEEMNPFELVKAAEDALFPGLDRDLTEELLDIAVKRISVRPLYFGYLPLFKRLQTVCLFLSE